MTCLSSLSHWISCFPYLPFFLLQIKRLDIYLESIAWLQLSYLSRVFFDVYYLFSHVLICLYRLIEIQWKPIETLLYIILNLLKKQYMSMISNALFGTSINRKISIQHRKPKVNKDDLFFFVEVNSSSIFHWQIFWNESETPVLNPVVKIEVKNRLPHPPVMIIQQLMVLHPKQDIELHLQLLRSILQKKQKLYESKFRTSWNRSHSFNQLGSKIAKISMKFSVLVKQQQRLIWKKPIEN